jgi:hypothetical protein
MGRIVVTEFISVDGVIEDPGGSEGFERGGWAFEFDRGPEGDRFKLDEVMASEVLLLGREGDGGVCSQSLRRRSLSCSPRSGAGGLWPSPAPGAQHMSCP